MITFNATAQQKAMETIGHLENQVLSSVLVGSGKEYKYWLGKVSCRDSNNLELYVRRLTNDANESKLHEICSQLLGPPHKVNSEALKKSNWEPLILVRNKGIWLIECRDFLRENYLMIYFR